MSLCLMKFLDIKTYHKHMSRHREFRAGSMLELRWKNKKDLSKEQINEHAQTLISIKKYCMRAENK